MVETKREVDACGIKLVTPEYKLFSCSRFASPARLQPRYFRKCDYFGSVIHVAIIMCVFGMAVAEQSVERVSVPPMDIDSGTVFPPFQHHDWLVAPSLHRLGR
jgi:hypothetical protein